MNKEKRSIQKQANSEAKHLLALLDKSDVSEFKKMVPELQDTWVKKQMFRTETEMRFSVLSDNKHGNNASKYWQSVREQNAHFENLMQLSFDYRKNGIKVKKLLRDIKKEKDVLEKEMKQIELEEKLYTQANMELVAKARMKEIATWSKLKKEFNDGKFDDKDVNTHQAESYMHTLEHRKATLTPGSSQPEVFNVLGQLDTLKRIRQSGELLPAGQKKKQIKK
jgi:MoaA/NifB/PqqE/SkfB family radical SAM enzyme|tara:strand:+ start:264 stop:932 length:669 start_codon:yes stop_codon:yes gene_type:complete